MGTDIFSERRAAMDTLEADFFVQQQQPTVASSGNVSLSGPEISGYAAPPQQPSSGGGGLPSFGGGPTGTSQQTFIPQGVSQHVAGQIARTVTEQTVGLLRRGAGEIRVYIERNHYSVHALSLCGGLALALVSFLGLLNVFATLTGPLSY